MFNSKLIARLAVVLILCFVSTIALAQPTLSKVFTPNTIGPGSVSRVTFTITNGTANPVTGLGFMDALPAGMALADPANLMTNCDLGASGTLNTAGSMINLSEARLAGGQSCSITVNVTSATVGTYTNPAVALTYDGSGQNQVMSLPVDLNVVNTQPGFSKIFSPNVVSVGHTSRLTLTIDNSANANGLPSLSFSDNLPSGILIAPLPNLVTDCGNPSLPATITADAGTSQIRMFANGFLPTFPALAAGSSCTVSVDVITNYGGAFINESEELIAGGTSAGFAVATLDVEINNLVKSFIDDPAVPGGLVTLDFTINNFDRSSPMTNISFSDDLNTVVAGLTFDSLLGNDCGGSVNGVGTTVISFSGGTLAAQGSCTISTQLAVAPATASGNYLNTTTALSANLGGSSFTGNTASDTLTVQAAPVVTKSFLASPVNPGDSVVLEFTVTNTSTTSSATDIEFEDILDTVFSTASATPGNDCLGVGSTCTYTPKFDPPAPCNPCDAIPAKISISGGTLAPAGMPGDSATFSFTLDVVADASAGTYLNQTSVISATVEGGTRFGQPAMDELRIISAPSLSLSFTDDPVAPGATVRMEYELSHSDDASSTANGILFNHNLSTTLAGLTAIGLPLTNACDPDGPGGNPGTGTISGFSGDTLLELQGANLAPGESCIIGIDLTVPAASLPGSYPSSTSTVGAVVDGQAVTSAAASDELKIAGLKFSKEFLTNPVIAGDTTTLRFTIENIHPTDDATITSFTDNLQQNLTGLAATGTASTDTCGGTLSGTTFLIYVGGSVLSGASCVIEVPVLVPASAADGAYANLTSALSADQGGVVVIDPATDVLEVNSSLIQLSKQFIDDPVAPGGTATLEFTVTNLDMSQAVSSINFTDDLDATLTGLVATGVAATDVCGAGSSISGTSLVTLSNGSLAAGASCTFSVSVNVPANANAGTYTNTTSSATGDINGLAVTGAPASDELNVTNVLPFSKSFAAATTATGSTTLTFSITNPSTTLSATSLSFSDDLNSVISGLIATSLPAVPCGMDSSISGISNLIFTGGTLAPMETCSFAVDVLVPVTATAGSYLNTTSQLFDSGLQVAAPATATLVIEPAPTFTKVFAPDSTGVGLISSLTFTIDNSASALAATVLDFTDNLPAGLAVATVPNASTSCAGGTITAVSGAGVISYTGGSVAAGASCTVQADVVSSTTGMLVNTTGDLTSSSGNSGTATDTLTVNSQPGFSKSFATNPSIIGNASTLTFTIDNSTSTVATTALDFTDNLPANMVVFTPANASTTCTGGTITAVDGASSISFTGGSVSAGTSCTISVDVTTSTSGDFVNTSGDLTSSLGNSGSAADTLTVEPPLGFSKIFASPVIFQGTSVNLSFLINNLSNTSATAIDFTDNLPAGIVVASPIFVVDGCGNGGTVGTLTAVPGTSLISYSGGSTTTGNCGITVRVTPSVVGSYVNTTGDLTSSLGNSGTATATLQVIEPPVFTKSFARNTDVINNPNTLTFTIDNTANTVNVPVGFIDNLPTGLLVATPSNASTTCGGTLLTATPGSNVIDYASGFISDFGEVAAGSTCTVSVDVIATMPGTFVNTSSVLYGGFYGDGTTPATDTLVVDPAPLFSKSFNPTAIGLNGVSSLEFAIDNSGSALDATVLDFVDNFPTDLVIAATPNPNTTCTGGTITATAGGSSMSYTGGTVTAGSSCIISVDVTSSTFGSYVNTSSDLTSSHGNSGSATDTLTVTANAFISKSFVPDVNIVNTVSRLNFTIDNTLATANQADMGFSDPLPAGLEIAAVPNLVSTCSAVLITADPGGTTISLVGGSLAQGATCTIGVDIVATTSGVFNNITNALVTDYGLSNQATATLTIEPPPTFTKVFVSDTIAVNDVSTLTFTIDNLANSFAASNLDFTDVFPAGVILANTVNELNTCSGGTLTAVAGTSSITYTGGSVAAGSTCMISVDVTSAVVGDFLNTSGDLTSSHGNSGPSSANLIVTGIPTFSKSFTNNPTAMNAANPLVFTIDNSSGLADIAGLTFTDNMPAGMVVAPIANVVNNCIGGTVTAAPGSSSISLLSGTVTAATSCTISVDVVVTVTGNLVNTTSLLSTSIGDSNQAVANLAVSLAPVFTKEFTPNLIVQGGVSQLVFTIDNSQNSLDATALDFVDNFPAGLTVANPANASSSCSAGTLNANSGSSVISYAGGTVAANSTCLVSVDVTASTVGTLTNISDALTSSQGNSGTAVDDLTVEMGLSLTKAFATNSIIAGENAEMILTLTNNASIAANQISFSDDLDAFISGAVGFGLPLTDVCGVGSSVTGTSVVTINNASLAANSSCQFSVMITVPENTDGGTYVNVTGPVSVDYNGATVVGAAGSGAAGNIYINGMAQVIPVMNYWSLALLMMLVLVLARYQFRTVKRN